MNTDPTMTTEPTTDQVKALADAMGMVLDDMGPNFQSVCRYTKAKARIAYAPFTTMMDDDCDGYMPLDEATRIVKETDDRLAP